MAISRMIILAKQGDQQCLLDLIRRFEPKINALSRDLRNECGRTDLTIFLIKLIYNLKLETFINKTDGALINYISIALQNEASRLNKEFCLATTELTEDFCAINNEYTNIENELHLDSLVTAGVITQRQREVLKHKYSYQCSDSEIALTLNVTRQNVNRIHRTALNNVAKYLS